MSNQRGLSRTDGMRSNGGATASRIEATLLGNSPCVAGTVQYAQNYKLALQRHVVDSVLLMKDDAQARCKLLTAHTEQGVALEFLELGLKGGKPTTGNGF